MPSQTHRHGHSQCQGKCHKGSQTRRWEEGTVGGTNSKAQSSNTDRATTSRQRAHCQTWKGQETVCFQGGQRACGAGHIQLHTRWRSGGQPLRFRPSLAITKERKTRRPTWGVVTSDHMEQHGSREVLQLCLATSVAKQLFLKFADQGAWTC